MRHEFTCKKCGAVIVAYCFEYVNYTEEGYKTRRRQMDSGLCIECFGEVPERLPVEDQNIMPAFNLKTGDIEALKI